MPTDGMDEQIRACLDQKLYTSAFDLVVTRYSAKVIHLAYSILGNRALAEEIAQDVFVRIWRALPAYRGLASVSTWIYTITRNTCLTAAKRARTTKALPLDEPAVRTEAEQLAFSPQPETLLSDLPRLLSHLPEKHRQVMMLFYMEEKSYEEVAHLLDIPIGTVKTYLHRARKALAAVLTEDKKEGDI